MNLSTQAYEQLRHDILNGSISPVEAVFEVHLAERLGMSRTPVREALKALAQEGYLEELPGRGYAVPRRSLDDLREFFELREVLEAAATRYAALRASAEEIERLRALCESYQKETDQQAWNLLGTAFHDVVIQACRNGRLQSFLESLNAQIQLSRRPVMQTSPHWRRAAIADHLAILHAIETRDEAMAYAAAAEHVRHSYAATLRAYQPESFSVPRAG